MWSNPSRLPPSVDKHLFPEQSRNWLGETVLVTVVTVVFVQAAEGTADFRTIDLHPCWQHHNYSWNQNQNHYLLKKLLWEIIFAPQIWTNPEDNCFARRKKSLVEQLFSFFNRNFENAFHLLPREDGLNWYLLWRWRQWRSVTLALPGEFGKYYKFV